MKQYVDMTYEDLAKLPIWRVVGYSTSGEVVTLIDHITEKKARQLEIRFAYTSGGIYDACEMPQHDNHVMQWEIIQSARRIIKTLEGMN